MPVRENALELVQSHREVRLVEVVEGSPSAGEVLPFCFAPDVTGAPRV